MKQLLANIGALLPRRVYSLALLIRGYLKKGFFEGDINDFPRDGKGDFIDRAYKVPYFDAGAYFQDEISIKKLNENVLKSDATSAFNAPAQKMTCGGGAV